MHASGAACTTWAKPGARCRRVRRERRDTVATEGHFRARAIANGAAQPRVRAARPLQSVAARGGSLMKRIGRRLLDGAAAGLVATLGMSLVMLGAKRLGALGEPPPRRLVRKLL